MAEVTKYGFTRAVGSNASSSVLGMHGGSQCASTGLCLSCCVGDWRHSEGILLAGIPQSAWCCDLKVSRPPPFRLLPSALCPLSSRNQGFRVLGFVLMFETGKPSPALLTAADAIQSSERWAEWHRGLVSYNLCKKNMRADKEAQASPSCEWQACPAAPAR